ncbi:MAG: sugar phosphate isomerase/epimerase [Oscillospiraceae bacterium]|jgi:sugar phosphate isomerase/epimerase|nr:sugar phosphate isomerase/epimerase [Oscillospiraceae bacterium]
MLEEKSGSMTENTRSVIPARKPDASRGCDLTGRVCVSTVAYDARATALEYGLGIELAEFCTAYNMDVDFGKWDRIARDSMEGIDLRVFHAPFNELCPAAIDPLVADVARRRYAQAYRLMAGYGIDRMVVHSGYVPLIYNKEYFAGRSIEFWGEFLRDKPGDFTLLLENVMEDSPDMLRDIVRGVGDKRMRLCLDIGHAGTIVSDLPVDGWIDGVSEFLKHVHVHNNFRLNDDHNPPGEGLIDAAAALRNIAGLGSGITFTLEARRGRESAEWLRDNGFLPPHTGAAPSPEYM